MKLYLNDEKISVDPRPLNDILWGLKALCDTSEFWNELFERVWCGGSASELHLVSIEDFQVYSEFLNWDLQITTPLRLLNIITMPAQQKLSAILF